MKISLFYRNLTVLDYAYLDDHLGVVGDSLKVNAEFVGRTDAEGVIYDFGHAKARVKEIIDRDCDHRLVVPRGLVEKVENRRQLKFFYGLENEWVSYDCPEQGICEIPYASVSKANLQSFLEEIVLREMPETVDAIKIELVEESFAPGKATFHYTHGLKEHYGNCQRLFHGHHNTVDVEINARPSPESERFLASELFKGNVHFCKWENVANREEIISVCGEGRPEGRYPELPQVKIEYQALQGIFRGSLPGRAVYFLQDESTVENLSMHFSKLIKAKVGEADVVSVRAYEGIAKGAKSTF